MGFSKPIHPLGINLHLDKNHLRLRLPYKRDPSLYTIHICSIRVNTIFFKKLEQHSLVLTCRFTDLQILAPVSIQSRINKNDKKNLVKRRQK